MAAITLTLPNFVKLRTASQRRYILVKTWGGEATIYKRSDSLETVTKEYGKHFDGNGARWFIVDTVDRATIRQRNAL